MRRFLVKMGIWAVVLIIPMLIIENYLLRHRTTLRYLIGPDILTALSNSKALYGKRTLILGDSVCNQLYPNDEEYPNSISLACNRAISLAGHYFLLKNYVETNVNALPDTVVLILTPSSLQNQLDRYAYHYMLKNFLTKEYKDEFNEELWTRIRDIPIWWTAPLPFIRVSNYSPEYNPREDNSYVLFSPISQTYLYKIVQLVDSIHAQLVFKCAPVDASQMAEWKQLFEKSAALEEVPGDLISAYIQSVRYVRDSISADGIHLKRDCIPSDYFGLLHN